MRADPADLVRLVLECLTDVLLDDVDRSPDTPLLSGTSGIDSIAIVELVAQCEDASGITLLPELIAPNAFASPRTLAAAFAASAASSRSKGIEP